MKRMFGLIVALCLCLCGMGIAEDAAPVNDYELISGQTLTADLDGDGSAEMLDWVMIEDGENYTEEVVLTVTAEDGKLTEWRYFLYMAQVFVADVDEDGIPEIFVTGDEMSSDYYTICLHYTAEGLIPMLFADVTRGNMNEGYYPYGYGLLTSVSEGTVILTGSQDILGTYFGSRAFGLQDGQFETVDDGLWRFEYEYIDDPEFWEYAALKPVVDITATFISEDGTEYDDYIAAGEKFVVTASDKDTVVYFRTINDRIGYFFVTPDVEWGFGYYISGLYETDVFEYIPYAD